jgi:hypothetical protein
VDGEGDLDGNLARTGGLWPGTAGQALVGEPGRAPRDAALAADKPLCASLDGFRLHAATRAGALDSAGREALLRYVLRPPVAQERVEQRPCGLVRITLREGLPRRDHRGGRGRPVVVVSSRHQRCPHHG